MSLLREEHLLQLVTGVLQTPPLALSRLAGQHACDVRRDAPEELGVDLEDFFSRTDKHVDQIVIDQSAEASARQVT